MSEIGVSSRLNYPDATLIFEHRVKYLIMRMEEILKTPSTRRSTNKNNIISFTNRNLDGCGFVLYGTLFLYLHANYHIFS